MTQGNPHNLLGRKFGRLDVIDLLPERKHNNRLWRCRCQCGKEVKATSYTLVSGKTQSCGCLQRERSRRYQARKLNRMDFDTMLERHLNRSEEEW